MTSRIPTPQVLLDDGTGTYPIDITSQVSLAAGINVSGHGRTDEFSTASAATLSLSLKNDDGSFSSGTGFGLGGFGAGFFGGLCPIAPGQGIRYKQTFGSTTVTRFTGRVTSLDLSWSGGTAKAATVTLSAVDPLASLAVNPLRSMLEEEILKDSPTAYYTLAEAEGSTAAGDTSGNTKLPLTIAGSGAALAFGGGIGPADGLSAVKFNGGKYLTASQSTLGTGVWSAAAFFSTSTVPAALTISPFLHVTSPQGSPGETLRLDINQFGGMDLLAGSSTLIAAGATDGNAHCAVVTFDGTNIRLYFDGVLAGTTTGTPALKASTQLSVGYLPSPYADPTVTVPFNGVVSHVALFDGIVLSAGRAAAYAAALTGFSETTAARFSRLAGYAGYTASTPVNSGRLMGAQDTSGQSIADALELVAATEGGVMFIDGTGTPVLQGRGYRAQKTTPTLTVPMKDVSVSTSLSVDTQQVVNQVTVTRTDGATQLVINQASVNAYGPFPQSLDIAVATDDEALLAAQWIANKHGTPQQRMGSATALLLTSAIAEQILQTEIGDRWALSGMPTQTWPGFGDLTVEGWSENLTVSSSTADWSMTLNLLPWPLFQSGIYDDATSLYDVAVYA